MKSVCYNMIGNVPSVVSQVTMTDSNYMYPNPPDGEWFEQNKLTKLLDFSPSINKKNKKNKKDKEMENIRRIVSIYVVDPDQNIPVNKALLYKKESFFTDETDQELLLGLNIKDMLDTHNKIRIELKDESIKSKEVKLEDIRIGDLRMQIITLCTFEG